MPQPQLSTPQLTSTLAADLADLVRKESALIRAEMSEKLGVALRAAAALALGALLLLGAFFAILATIVLALAQVMAPVWACLVGAGIFAVLGAVAGAIGAARIRPQVITPDRTLSEVHELSHFVAGKNG